MVATAIDLAAGIAEKSPIAVQGTKANLVYARDHSVPEGLEYAVCENCLFYSQPNCTLYSFSCS